MCRVVTTVLLVFLIGAIGCGRTVRLHEPEDVVASVLVAVKESRYAGAVQYLKDGPNHYETSSEAVRAFLDRITDKGNAVTFEVRDRQENGDTVKIQITTYSDKEKKNPLRTSVWHFAKTKSGWIITRVE